MGGSGAMRSWSVWLVVLAVTAQVLLPVQGQPQAEKLEVSTGRYRFPAELDRNVLRNAETEVWAEVYYPTVLKSSKSAGPFPLVIFLHGNHGTCGRQFGPIRVDDSAQYTGTGTCPEGYVVVPNHEGYRYLGRPLASRGYIVVSINANRGITAGFGPAGDRFLITARGSLVLKHLTLLTQWNRRGGAPSSVGFDVQGTIDMQQIGLMGHSRGGEGVRSALDQFARKVEPWASTLTNHKIRALYEVAPVDGQSQQEVNVNGVASMVLLPSCDGDVFDLQGMAVFDRVFEQKAARDRLPKGTILVVGANHNFYNTEWQVADSDSCDDSKILEQDRGGFSKPQQFTLVRTLIPFMRAYVGADRIEGLGRIFDPSRSLPASLDEITFFSRNFLRNPIGRQIRLVETFSNRTGLSDRGIETDAENISVTHGRARRFAPVASSHDVDTRVADISWSRNSAEQYFQLNVVEPGSPFPRFERAKTISFRIASVCITGSCAGDIEDVPPVDFDIQFVDSEGDLSLPRPLSDFATLYKIVEGKLAMQTVDLPVRAFRGADFDRPIAGIRFTFNKTPRGEIVVTDFAADSRLPAVLPSGRQEVEVAEVAAVRQSKTKKMLVSVPRPPVRPPVPMTENSLVTVTETDDAEVEITIRSSSAFPITNSVPTLYSGDQMFRSGVVLTDRTSITFVLSREEYASLNPSALGSIRIGRDYVWQLGSLRR